MFGPHLLVCGYNANKLALSSLEQMYSPIDELPDLVGMTKITQTSAFRYQGKVASDWGITAAVMIAESHISIHTFPAKNFFAFDLFSCRDFDTEAVVSKLAQTFEIVRADMSVDVIERGKGFVHTDV